MAKVTKAQLRRHEQALELVALAKSGTKLNEEQCDFVFANYYPSASNHVVRSGAYFTPPGLAREMMIEVPLKHTGITRVIDLCAGIGMLSYKLQQFAMCADLELVCVEINAEYCDVGQALVPSAKWYNMDVMDHDALKQLGHFDACISNPPFGNVASMSKKPGLHYRGNEAEYKVIESASIISNVGVFILPFVSAGFQYSGVPGMMYLEGDKLPDKLKKFREETGIEIENNCGIDTSPFKNEWQHVNVSVEIALCDFRHLHTESGIAA